MSTEDKRGLASVKQRSKKPYRTHNYKLYCRDCFAAIESECLCNRIVGYDAETGVPIVDISDDEWHYLYDSHTEGTN
jgi:DTW domain-containing protein YfiP